ncbi:MAG TPA: hypothetical protein VHF58_03120 [Solirubrobacterales bacterium]|nr:hypothetical protein [Solirubrobacterales bacterium]
MRTLKRTKIAVAAVLALAASGALAALALGVNVYSNDFSSEAEYEQIVRTGGGKSCERVYRSKQNAMLVTAKKGPLTCGFRVPVEGDSELPNHAAGLETKLLSSTAKGVRDGAFVEVTLRAGGGGVGYTLRVFPARKKFELVRGPGGGGEFPARGKDGAINGVNERNNISLVARGAQVSASVNGKELASVQDSNPGQVTGRKVRIAAGGNKRSSKDVAVIVRRVTVGVPTR